MCGLTICATRLTPVAKKRGSSAAPGMVLANSGSKVPCTAELFAILRRSSASLLAYRSHPGRLGINLLLAVGEQCLQFAKFFVLGRALGIAIPTLPFCAGIAVVMFARRVTGYLESLGLSEGVSVLLFTVLGVGKDTAVALALANYAVTTVAMLPGAYLLYRNIPQIRRSISTESVSSPATARKE